MVSYKLRQASVNDKSAIYDLLVASFYADMPLFAACNAVEPPSIDVWPALQELGQGFTVVAVNDEDDVIGVAINVVTRDDGSSVTVPESIEGFVNAVDGYSKGLVTRLSKSTMELIILTVAKAYRRKGIAKKLIQETENIAKSNGHTNIFAIATGAYMADGFRGENWEAIYTYFYKDYVKVDPDFRVPPLPHDSVNVFEKKLL